MSDQPKCPHCHASMTHLHALIERLDTTAVQTVRCTLCGWRISRVQAVPKYENTNREANERKAGRPAGKVGSQNCTVVGCERHPTVGAPWGMCGEHRKAMRQWSQSSRRFGCPYKKITGGGYVRATREERRSGANL